MGKRPLLLIFICVLFLCWWIKPGKVPIERYMEQLEVNENHGIIQGVITSVTEKENSLELSMKDCRFWKKKDSCSIEKILIYLKKEVIQEELHIGNQVQVSGGIQLFQKPTNLGQFNEYDYYKGKNYDCKMYADSIQIANYKQSKLKEYLRKLKVNWQKIYQQQLPKSQAGVIEAMVLGEKTNLDSEIKELYQKNGIGHIMAISGLHISFWGMGIYRLLKRLGLGEKFSVFFSIIVIYLYGMMTGFSVSAVRAVIMMILALIAHIVGRTYDMLSAMSFSGIITLLCNPMQVRNCGFLLSYGAIIGVGVCYPILKEIFNSKSKLIDCILVTISIQIVLLPVTAWFFYEIPLYGSFLNLLVLPAMSLLLTISILGVFCTYLYPPIGTFVFGTVYIILKYYEVLCKNVIRLPFSSLVTGKPSVIQIILYSVLVVFALYLFTNRKGVKWVFLFLMAFLMLFPVPVYQFEATILDVGQGDSIFFQTGRLSYLIDGGSSDVKNVGTYRILPFLKAKGIQTLDVMIVSHTDKDHINGLLEILEQTKKKQFRVRCLMLPKIENPDRPYYKMEQLAKQSGIKIYYLEKGIKWKKEKLQVVCLHPNPDFSMQDKNECSMILSIQYGEARFLFTGDVEEEGEKEILPYLEYHDVLKVAHHGSKSSSTEEFLEKVNPKVGLISCGLHNSYGHPHKEVIDRMRKRKIKIYNTSINGAISLKSNGKTMRITKIK